MYVSIVNESESYCEAICVENLHELVEDFDENPNQRPGRISHRAIAIKDDKWKPKDDSIYSSLLAEELNGE